jgi:hypothetical protein
MKYFYPDRIHRGGGARVLLLILLIVLVLAVLPTWPYSTEWGYYPSGGLGLIVLIVIILYLLGYLRF